MDLGPVPQWALEEYCSECANLKDVKSFGATAENDMNFEVLSRNRFAYDTVLGV